MIWRLFLSILAAQSIVFEASAEQDIGVLPRPDIDGFITLFNGRDLTGWTGLAEYWSVRDGSISGHENKDTSRQTFLVLSALKAVDFELHFKYRFASAGGNSGLQFRSVVLDSTTYRVGGYQADFDAEGRFDGSIYDEAGAVGSRGTMSNRGDRTTWDSEGKRHVEPLLHSDTDLQSAIRLGDWNDAILIVRGNHIVYSINDHVMTDLFDGSPSARQEGILALQLHQGFTMDVRFKDLRIKLLHE
jgi:Domain of Unknown Function (DUF1080)